MAWVVAPALVPMFGCTTVDGMPSFASSSDTLERPEHIIVYDFCASPADMPLWTTAARRYADQQPLPVDMAVGRQLGEVVAAELASRIDGMGLESFRREERDEAALGDILITGVFLTQPEGSREPVLGFGSGTTDLTVEIEGYLLTEDGPRLLGAAAVHAPGSAISSLATSVSTPNPMAAILSGRAKANSPAMEPGMPRHCAATAANAIAERLRVAFRKQGWI